jgi:protocatechuate 3,4-dioxygenase beta subunit
MFHLALLALLTQSPAVQPAPAGAIQGVVVKGGTSEALSRATVELRGDDGPTPQLPAAPALFTVDPPPLLTTTTEADGRFLFRNVRPGRYRLSTNRPGYVRRPMSVTVTPGRTEDVQLIMTATGAIAGRVYGPNGESIGNVDVSALKPSYQNGRRVLTAVQSVRTDDRGEYRLFWLAPGRYFVRATHPQAVTGLMAMMSPGSIIGAGFEGSNSGGGGPGPNAIYAVRSTGDPVLFDAFGANDIALRGDRYVPVFFPGTSDEQGAAAIDLRAGADTGGIDVPVAPVRERHVRGVVVNGATGQVAQYAGLSEVQTDPLMGRPGGGPDGGLSRNGLPAIDPDGSFDVTLLPGRHTLSGTAGAGVGYVTIEVRDADIDGVRIVAMPQFDIAGRIVSDGPLDATALANTRISLRRELPVPMTPTSYSVPRADGTFVVSATPGDYRVNFAPLLNLIVLPGPFLTVPPGLANAYVKAITLGDVDVLTYGVRFDRPPTSPLEIVIGANPGVIDGTVAGSTQTAATGTSVVLIPNARNRFDLFKTATADPSGRFHFDRVPPGDYKVFAWDDLSDGAWQDPDFIRAYEDRGTPVRVGEGAKASIRLTTIALQ